MRAEVIELHTAAADGALAATDPYLDRCKLAANTVKAYRWQSRASRTH